MGSIFNYRKSQQQLCRWFKCQRRQQQTFATGWWGGLLVGPFSGKNYFVDLHETDGTNGVRTVVVAVILFVSEPEPELQVLRQMPNAVRG